MNKHKHYASHREVSFLVLIGALSKSKSGLLHKHIVKQVCRIPTRHSQTYSIVKHIDRMLTTTLALGFRVSGLDRQVAHSDLGRPWPAGSALIIHVLIYIFARSVLHLCSSCKTCKTCVSFNLTTSDVLRMRTFDTFPFDTKQPFDPIFQYRCCQRWQRKTRSIRSKNLSPCATF